MEKEASPLSGKIALVTGGGRGIGAACARLFAKQGARVVIASRTQSELLETARSVEKDLGEKRILPVACDVSDEAAVHDLFERSAKAFGGVPDILVNNAATITVSPLVETSAESWDEQMRINLRGPFLCSKAMFAAAKIAPGPARAIVNLSSLGGIRGTTKFTGFAAYTTSKSGIVGLTEVLAVEGKELGIRVNCVAPGAVETVMLKKAAPFLNTKTKPEDIAKVIYFLADPAQSGAVTGATIEVYSNA